MSRWKQSELLTSLGIFQTIALTCARASRGINDFRIRSTILKSLSWSSHPRTRSITLPVCRRQAELSILHFSVPRWPRPLRLPRHHVRVPPTCTLQVTPLARAFPGVHPPSVKIELSPCSGRIVHHVLHDSSHTPVGFLNYYFFRGQQHGP